jgi:crossover junction endodeoxyribonuclease RuvC
MPNVVLGLDPGFASLGWCACSVTAGSVRAVAAGVLRTKKSAAKHGVYASDDNLTRARFIYSAFDAIVVAFQPAALCAESMSFPRNASAAAKVAMSWGVIAAVAEAHALPVLQASPQAVKLALCGKKDASKEEVQAALRVRIGDLDPLLLNVPKGQHEHPYDAGAVVVACGASDVMRLLVRA